MKLTEIIIVAQKSSVLSFILNKIELQIFRIQHSPFNIYHYFLPHNDILNIILNLIGEVVGHCIGLAFRINADNMLGIGFA